MNGTTQRPPIRRFSGLVCAMALIVSACSEGDTESGGDAAESATDSVTTSAPANTEGSADESDDALSATTTAAPDAPPTTMPRPTEIELVFDEVSGEFVEAEVEVPGPSTFDGVVDAGVEAGLWDELEGLRRVLGHAVGALPAEQVPGVEHILTGELSGVLRRAQALALAGDHTEDELADLRRWYELAVPGNDVLEMLVTGAGGEWTLSDHRQETRPGSVKNAETPTSATDSRARTLGLAQGSAGCAPVDPEDFSGWAVIEGCYEMLEDTGEGVTLRVLYPSWYKEDAALADLPVLALEALVHSVSTYKDLAQVGDMTAVFSLVETTGSGNTTLAVATVDSQWDTATLAGCPVTVFPAAGRAAGNAFQQTIAHEAWHCVQHYNSYPTGVPSGTAWFIEAGAEYFSNVVYPSVNDEHVWLGKFDRISRTDSLLSMSYEAWIWWQFLGNRESPQFVANLQQQMADAGDGGVAAMNGYGPIFQRFVVEYVSGSISDQSGVKLPRPRLVNTPEGTVAKNDAGKVLEFVASAFVAVRHAVAYDKELRVFQSDQTQTNGEVAMVEWKAPLGPDDWRQVYPEVRSRCKNKTYYMVVATTADGPHQARIQIDRIEEASCDPCVLGTWELDLATFGNMLNAAMAAQGGALPPGAEFTFSGNYYTSLDDRGVMREQRDGLVFHIGVAEGALSFTIDSFAEGKYTADGERMAAFDVIQHFANVTTSIPGLGGAEFAQGSSILGGALGKYECRTDDMTMTVDGLEPIRWIRIDKILQPPTTVAP